MWRKFDSTSTTLTCQHCGGNGGRESASLAVTNTSEHDYVENWGVQF